MVVSALHFVLAYHSLPAVAPVLFAQPDDAHERCRDVVHVSLSRLVLPYPRHEAISQFHDKADLIEALAASCHIPMYANGAWTTQFRGATYVDGGVTHFVPSPPSQTVVKVCW